MVSTLHNPNSVVPAFAFTRFDRDAVYEEFAEQLNIEMTSNFMTKGPPQPPPTREELTN